MRVGFKAQTQNEDGYALLATMLLLVLLTVIGIAASHTSNVESQIGVNVKQYEDCFYDAEGALIQALENSNAWLSVDFLTTAPTAANISYDTDANGDGTNDTTVEVRCVESSATSIATLSAFADNVPADSHITAPPAGSGYSMKYFQVRKYAVSVNYSTCNTNVQSGVWKVFNKF